MSQYTYVQAQGAFPLVDTPAWTLADDNSGMDLMLKNQARRSSLAVLNVCVCEVLAHGQRQLFRDIVVMTCPVQKNIQMLTNVQSAITTLQSCIILLSLMHLASFASTVPYLKLILGV